MSSNYVKVSRFQGAGITNIDGIIGWLQYDSAAPSGTIFTRSRTEADHLYISTNEADYVSIPAMVDGTTDAFKFQKARGLDPGIETGKALKVVNLVPGLEFETETYVSTSTGAITSGTALGTELGVNSSGLLWVKQSSGIGSVRKFRLLGNHITNRNTIEVRYDPA